jgi:hypothetical protein
MLNSLPTEYFIGQSYICRILTSIKCEAFVIFHVLNFRFTNLILSIIRILPLNDVKLKKTLKYSFIYF